MRYIDSTGHRVEEGVYASGKSCDQKLKKSKPKPCKDKRDLTDWIVGALPDSANHPGMQEIAKRTNNRIERNQPSMPSLQAGKQFKALVEDGAYFDVKDKMEGTVGQTIKLGSNWYEFSTAGNILYGFYGYGARIDLYWLHIGAGYAQREDYKNGRTDKIGPLFKYAYDTSDDYYAVEFGYQLYHNYYLDDGVLTVSEFTHALDNYPNRDKMAIKDDPGNCIPAKESYPTDMFYQK